MVPKLTPDNKMGGNQGSKGAQVKLLYVQQFLYCFSHPPTTPDNV